MKHITSIRKAVCIIANRLHKEGYSLSVAFKRAWQTVKGHTFRAAGVTADNGQEKLSILRSFPLNDLQIGFRREPGNQYDSNAIQILVKVISLNKYCCIGYVPHTMAVRMAAVMDQGVKIRGKALGVIGGYVNKENLGLLVSMAV